MLLKSSGYVCQTVALFSLSVMFLSVRLIRCHRIAAGPSGFTVREIIRQTEADIKSWTDKCEDDTTRPTRTFIIEVVSLPSSSFCHLSLRTILLMVCRGRGSGLLTCRHRMQGPKESMAKALMIMCDAIARYKDLCEGAYAGQCVSSTQRMHGIDFSYQPPPRTIVPHAAGLKGQSHRCRHPHPFINMTPHTI